MSYALGIASEQEISYWLWSFLLSKNRGSTPQLEVKFGKFYWVVLIPRAVMKKGSKHERVEGCFLNSYNPS